MAAYATSKPAPLSRTKIVDASPGRRPTWMRASGRQRLTQHLLGIDALPIDREAAALETPNHLLRIGLVVLDQQQPQCLAHATPR